MNAEKGTYPDLCVCCGAEVPEGRLICFACEYKNAPQNSSVKSTKLKDSIQKPDGEKYSDERDR